MSGCRARFAIVRTHLVESRMGGTALPTSHVRAPYRALRKSHKRLFTSLPAFRRRTAAHGNRESMERGHAPYKSGVVRVVSTLLPLPPRGPAQKQLKRNFLIARLSLSL